MTPSRSTEGGKKSRDTLGLPLGVEATAGGASAVASGGTAGDAAAAGAAGGSAGDSAAGGAGDSAAGGAVAGWDPPAAPPAFFFLELLLPIAGNEKYIIPHTHRYFCVLYLTQKRREREDLGYPVPVCILQYGILIL